MNSGQYFDIEFEEYLEARFKKGTFPSFQEVLATTDIRERGADKEELALKEKLTGFRNRLHLDKHKATYKRHETSYSPEELPVLIENMKQSNQSSAPKWIKYAALNFNSKYIPEPYAKLISAIFTMHRQRHDMYMDLIRDPKISNSHRKTVEKLVANDQALREEFREIIARFHN